MCILIIILALILIFWIATIFTYGWYISDESIYDVLQRHKTSKISLNMFNASIINIGNMPYISSLPASLSCKYYISGMGIIPRWSKSHKLIKQCYKEALENL